MSKKRFIYHGYLQIAELDAAATESAMPVLRKTYLWDPLEPAATRILAMGVFDETGVYVEDLYYTHDALKNTTALFGIKAGRRALYEYGPYGNVLKMEGGSAEILSMNRADGIFISLSRTIHACTLIRLAFLKMLKRNVARMV